MGGATVREMRGISGGGVRKEHRYTVAVLCINNECEIEADE